MTFKYTVNDESRPTPALNQTTLFVEGLPDYQELLIEMFNNKATHVCLGADGSFETTTEWLVLLKRLVGDNILVTLHHKEDQLDWIKHHDFYYGIQNLIFIGE